MKILCATDFGDRADAAVRVAAVLARSSKAVLELVHVIPPAATDPAALVADAAVLDREIRARAQEQLAALGQTLGDTVGSAIELTLLSGAPERALLDHASAVSADLIVMGAHSRGAAERLLLGSVAERTIRHSDRPVLIVPPGVQGWPAVDCVTAACLCLVVALDGGHASDGALAFVRALRTRMACDVTFLRLYWPPEEYQRLGLTGARDFFGPDPDVIADLEVGLRRRVGVLPGGGDVAFVVEPAWGEPASRLLDAARGHAADLVVVGAESRHGLSRLVHPPVASRLARAARDIPVVFVPAPPPATGVGVTSVPRLFTVLAPTDLSSVGNRAVPFAYTLLAGHGGVVELCHVHERALASPPYAYDRPQGRLSDGQRAELQAALRSLIPAEAERLGITTHVSVIDGGESAEAIVQAAERLAVDAIALGSHGRGRAARALMGSVAESVLRRAGRPVFVVPSRPGENS